MGFILAERGSIAMNEKRDKLIVQTLGECWHECGKKPDYACPKCGETNTDLQGWYINPASLNIDLSTPSGFFWTWDKLWEKRLAIKFMKYYSIKHLGEPEPGFMPFELLNINLCMNALAGFLESKCLKK